MATSWAYPAISAHTRLSLKHVPLGIHLWDPFITCDILNKQG